ncbi:MAG: hypothetical protein FJ271_22155 [Planctomycetes bacterium]|nr:hypothetical protein [Planctomycetota bacterium]
MHRQCAHCQRSFAPSDFAKAESKDMEGMRKRLGLTGVRFVYYCCPGCGYDEIFVDEHPLPGEAADDFERRRDLLAAAVRESHGEHVEVVLTERH